IAISGAGPFHVPPTSLRGKSLTIRAAEGHRPRLVMVHSAEGQPWQPLLAADCPLRLEGLDLAHEAGPSESGTETVHLVYVEKASLQMTNCHVSAPRGSAAVVCRGCQQVQIEDCRLSAAALALCVETTGSAETEIILTRNHVEIEAPRSAALSLWAAE